MATIVPVSAKAAPAPAAPATSSVVVDIEATVKAEVAKAVAAAKVERVKIVNWVEAEESKFVTYVKTYFPHVAAAAAGYAASAFGVIEKLWKFI